MSKEVTSISASRAIYYPSHAMLAEMGFTSIQQAAHARFDLAQLSFTNLPESSNPFLAITGDQPIVAHVPHAGIYTVSDAELAIDLSDFKRNALLLTDWLTDDLFGSLSESLGGNAVFNQLNRFYFDPERYADRTREPMEETGMGVFYRTGCDGKPLRRSLSGTEYKALIDKYHRPYHRTLVDLASTAYQRHGELMVVDCHSFPAEQQPYEGDKQLERPEICLGVNCEKSSAALIAFWQAACAEQGYSFGVNQPFPGALIPDSVSARPQVLGFMIEVNQGTYLDECRIAPHYGKIKHFLDQTLETCFEQRSSLCNGA